MFPNPQSALPLPPHPDIANYKKLAKALVKACRSAAPDAIAVWAEQWVDDLVRLCGLTIEHQPVSPDRWIDGLQSFARRKLQPRCLLADAQFVIARSHGFESWPKFLHHIEAADRPFEQAADAIVVGDQPTLEHLLRQYPALVQARSTREHRATLLHYVSANGVEGYRQKTPPNIVQLADVMLQSGAEVDATARVYGGERTTLLLTATSGHPEVAGVQDALMQMLLDHGASVPPSIVMDCLHNGRRKAAAFLAARGANLTLAGAAALGMMDHVRTHLRHADLQDALLQACQYGTTEAAEYLIEHGASLAQPEGRQTALHMAVVGGQLETIRMLLRHHPPLEAVNEYGGTPFGQALWSAAHGGDPETYIAILEALTTAGAETPERHTPVNGIVDAWLAQHGSLAEPSWYWFGEQPRRPR